MLNTSETPFHANEKWIKAANINERIFNIETPSVGSLSLAVNIDNVRIISVSTASCCSQTLFFHGGLGIVFFNWLPKNAAPVREKNS